MNDAQREQEARDDRDETTDEQLDRNTIELLNELRVAGAGIQIMLAFLLVVPFNTGWKRTSSFERTDYFVTLALVAVAAFLLMAPPIQHRLLFRHHEKRYLVTMGNRFAIAGMACLAFGFTGILVLLSDYVRHRTDHRRIPDAGDQRAACGSSCRWFSVPASGRRGTAAQVGLPPTGISGRAALGRAPLRH